jgi:hypothetical protein
MTEKAYRAITRDSYSSIKDFLDDRKKYYRKHVLKEKIEEILSSAMIFGNLVDCLLLEPNKFEERFHVAQCQVPPPQMKRLSEALFERTLQDLDEEGRQTHDLDHLINFAYDDVKYDKDGNEVAFRRKGQTKEKVKQEFFDGPGIEWYKQLRLSYGKYLVELREVENAENVVKELKTNEVTQGIVNLANDKRYGIYNQEKILFSYQGNDLKCMIDKIIVDHEQHRIFVYDLKTTWNVEDQGFMKNFFHQRYYIQAAVYDIATKIWANDIGLSHYEVVPMKFIVTDSNNYMGPLIYECTPETLHKALEGFEYQGKEYIGLNQALEELNWHKETGKWTGSVTNMQNKGRVTIKF